jgi:hypothetical protein
MKNILLLIVILTSNFAVNAQNIEFNDSPCCDSNGVVNDKSWFIPQPYKVKKYKKKYHYAVTITQFRIGKTEFNINVNYKGRIKSSTPLILIDDNYAIKIYIGKADISDFKSLLIRMDIYVRDAELKCWRLQQTTPTYYSITSNPQNLGFFSYGLPNGGFWISQGIINIQ